MVATIEDAVALVAAIVRLPGSAQFVRETDRLAKAVGLQQAVRNRDTPALFDWLMASFSLQGISDRIAWGYIAAHGNAEWSVIERSLEPGDWACPKLATFRSYHNCGYRKSTASCHNPAEIGKCPVPKLPLRKGDLNQLAFSLYLFLRDECGGDLVGFIDQTFASVNVSVTSDRISAKSAALTAAFSKIHAVSAKLVAMTFAPLLMAAGRRRRDWVEVGRSLIAIDSLVHNFLHRTGILAVFDRSHAYGPRCYRSDGCVGVIQEIAAQIDASEINSAFPPIFPRLIQFALWAFCTEAERDICNGRQIDDWLPCQRDDCPVGRFCSRIPLRSKQA